VIKYKPKHLSRLVEIRRDSCSGRVAQTIQKSVEALMRSREVVARSKNLLIEIRQSRRRQKNLENSAG
jgi:hypothetical protein